MSPVLQTSHWLSECVIGPGVWHLQCSWLGCSPLLNKHIEEYTSRLVFHCTSGPKGKKMLFYIPAESLLFHLVKIKQMCKDANLFSREVKSNRSSADQYEWNDQFKGKENVVTRNKNDGMRAVGQTKLLLTDNNERKTCSHLDSYGMTVKSQ